MWERNDIISYVSDSHKELHGFRPRPDWDEIPTADLQAWADSLSAQIAASIEERNRQRLEWAEKRAGYFTAPPPLSIGDLVNL
jgi:hypothetical protein